MNAQLAILRIIGQARHPVGWYSIALRLGMEGIAIEENLVTLLNNLQSQGLVQHIEQGGYPHGAYRLTGRGNDLLASQQSEQDL
jgi:repressor of nif and glnA expression